MTDYSERLATRISPGVDRRLRLAAALGRHRLGELVDQLLDQGLPSNEELAEQAQGGAISGR
jgi:predicted HicB family RNase H-like nuclease